MEPFLPCHNFQVLSELIDHYVACYFSPHLSNKTAGLDIGISTHFFHFLSTDKVQLETKQ